MLSTLLQCYWKIKFTVVVVDSGGAPSHYFLNAIQMALIFVNKRCSFCFAKDVFQITSVKVGYIPFVLPRNRSVR